jgi:hypothetical protein
MFVYHFKKEALVNMKKSDPGYSSIEKIVSESKRIQELCRVHLGEGIINTPEIALKTQFNIEVG